ncbi:MAG: hypothetical protein AVDCRST_MAG01-01-2660 [uncultured Rubrobacteraceae bacterium]|uniref:DUF2188 domain-containing protein n=1 Tax=uncultured Rubrobacteraceae bacterium TaxID=349277 RepID=A0A6J4Q039_9ACTN|nr:MAG: hypothetical protein AVDCRST_MAG01-01-2660 [uncultured Rubrobacteraceae bacterium]
MGRKKKSGGEKVGYRVAGRVTETAGIMSGDADLEAEGRTTARSADRTTYTVTPRDGGGWSVQAEGASRATSVHDSKDEAVSRAKKLAGDRPPSQLLVYKKDGTVQSEQTYG